MGGSLQAARRRPALGVELVDIPPEPVDRRSALSNKHITSIGQQLQLPRHLVMGGHRQVRFTQHRPGHRLGIDRIGLSTGARRLAGLGHQLGGHPHHGLPRPQQIAFQPRRHVAAVLDAPRQLGAESITSPHQGHLMDLGGRADRLLSELAAHLVDGDEGVTALVYIGSNNNHGGCLLHCEGVEVGPAGGHISVGAMRRSHQVTPVGPSHPVPALRLDANP